MESEITVKELSQKLWEFEREFELLDLEIKGVRFWELIRFKVFSELSRQLCGSGQAHTSKDKISDKMLAVFNLLRYSGLRNPFSKVYEVDFLVYDHPRKVNVEGNNIDIYTNEFINSNLESKFDIIESPHLWKHVTSDVNRNRRYRDHEILTVFAKKKLSSITLASSERSLLAKLNSEMINRFRVKNFDLLNITENHVNNFLHKFEYHKKLFLKRKPKSIYMVVSYGKEPIIAAAKDLGIKVIEFQHGVITDYHFAYNFSEPSKELKYFPDKILTFGEYWAHTEGFPKQTTVEVYGFPYLNQQLKKYEGTTVKENQVLFISQGTIGKELSKRAKELAENMPNYHFIYKLHPGEYDRWRTEYPELVAASGFDNFEVIDDNEKNLYAFLAESEFQMGVYSTAIFEGLTLNCKTILFQLPGIEYMNDLIDRDILKVVQNKEEAIHSIINYQSKEFPRDYFFKEDSSD